MRFVSNEVYIPSEDFGPNPYLTEKGFQEGAAREEAARDLLKHPRQLLADIHAESLNPRPDFVARTLARMASMQLRVQEQSKEQTIATKKLNKLLLYISIGAAFLALVSLCITGYQTYLTYQQTYLTKPHNKEHKDKE